MNETHIDVVDDFYQHLVRPLGNLVVICAQTENALLEMVTAFLGDEIKTNKLVHGEDAKDRVKSLVSQFFDEGFERDELTTALDKLYEQRVERNHLYHAEWFPNIFEN